MRRTRGHTADGYSGRPLGRILRPADPEGEEWRFRGCRVSAESAGKAELRTRYRAAERLRWQANLGEKGEETMSRKETSCWIVIDLAHSLVVPAAMLADVALGNR